MTPRKIIFFTRDTQTPLHCAMARHFREIYPDAKILFASFFSQSCHYAEEDGFESYYFPDALREIGGRKMPEAQLRELDAFCRSEGMGLNSMLQTERFLPEGREAAERFMHQHLLALDSIIETDTLGISTMYDHFVYLAAAMMTHWKQGAFFAFVGCGVPGGRVIGLRLPWQPWKNPDQQDYAADSLEKCRQEVLLPSEKRIDYMKKKELSHRLTMGERWRMAAMRKSFAKKDYESGCYFPTQQRNRLNYALRWRWRAFRNGGVKKVWDVENEKDLAQVQGKTVFMALHMEPEATILMYSPRMRDQIESVRLVGEALPVGFTLLVKENPKMPGKRSPGFYQALQGFPNVRLVSTAVSSSALIERSEAVVSLAGTVTIEARLRGKYAYCFGRPVFWAFAHATGIDAVLDALSRLSDAVLPDKNGAATDTINEETWQDWIRATFVGKSGCRVFNPRIGRLSYDPGEDNVTAFVGFMTSCLRKQPTTPTKELQNV